MRRLLAAILITSAWALLSSAALPNTITFQGLLKTSGGVVVNGTKSIRFTLYDQAVGGSQLWTETQSLLVDNGEVHGELGLVTPYDDTFWSTHGGYYLQVEVMGSGGFEMITPRQKLTAVPFSSEASSLHGDVETEPARLKIEFGVGLPTTSIGNVDLSSTADGTGLTFMDSSKVTGGVAKGTIKGIGSGAGGASLSLESDVPLSGTAGFSVETMADDLGPVSGAGSDHDADRHLDGTHAMPKVPRSILKSFFSNGASPTQSQFASIVSSSGADITLHAADLNRDGNTDLQCTPDSVVQQMQTTSSTSNVIINMRTRLDALEMRLQALGLLGTMARVTTTCGDGATTEIMDSSASGARSKGIIVVKGSGGTGGATQTLSMENPATGADVSMEMSAQETRTELKGRFETGDVPTASDFKDVLDSYGIHNEMHSSDVDHDGQVDLVCTPDSIVDISQVSNGSQSSSFNMRNRLTEIESVLKNLGLLARSSATTSCGDGATVEYMDSASSTGAKAKGIISVKSGTGSGSSHRLTMDSDGDGVDDGAAEMAAQPYKTYLSLSRNASPESRLIAESDTSGPHMTLGDATSDGYMEMSSSPGSGPTSAPSSSFRLGRPAVNTALTVANEHGSRMSTQSPSGSAHIQCWDGSCRVLLVDATMGSEDTSIVIDGTARRFGIGVTTPDSPIQHSSGARLTVAGDWTNASDINLKENFRKVDREKLLDQIEKLKITQWNYRNQSDNVTHIGPTAQDFKSVFGVGDNDKTISTIDPSGIALAAIQELTRQNRELAQRNENLAEELAELKGKVDKLLAK